MTGPIAPQGHKEKFSYEGITFALYVPRDRGTTRCPLRLLLSQHGTRDEKEDWGSEHYMDIPLDAGDPDRYGLVVVAPQVPASEIDPNAPIHGENFENYDSPYCHWLHGLVHKELPRLFRKLQLTVATDRFYLYGQSLGGEFVRHYIMTFGGGDILRAAAAAGRYTKDSDTKLKNMHWSKYAHVLDSVIRTPVAFIVGYKDSACGSGETIEGDGFLTSECVKSDGARELQWRRIHNVQRFICQEVRLRVAPEDFALLRVPPPHDDGPDGAELWCENYDSIHNFSSQFFPAEPVPGVEVLRPLLQPWVDAAITPLTKGSMQMRFMWGPDGHDGRENYKVARLFMFVDPFKR